MVSKTVYTDIEVDVDISDFETTDLIEELELRGIPIDDSMKEMVDKIYQKKRLNQNYEPELNELIYYVLGKFV
jgi:hypothetical protein